MFGRVEILQRDCWEALWKAGKEKAKLQWFQDVGGTRIKEYTVCGVVCTEWGWVKKEAVCAVSNKARKPGCPSPLQPIEDSVMWSRYRTQNCLICCSPSWEIALLLSYLSLICNPSSFLWMRMFTLYHCVSEVYNFLFDYLTVRSSLLRDWLEFREHIIWHIFE